MTGVMMRSTNHWFCVFILSSTLNPLLGRVTSPSPSSSGDRIPCRGPYNSCGSLLEICVEGFCQPDLNDDEDMTTYSGMELPTAPSPCQGVICTNGGNCSGGVCICPLLYTGDTCQTRIQDHGRNSTTPTTGTTVGIVTTGTGEEKKEPGTSPNTGPTTIYIILSVVSTLLVSLVIGLVITFCIRHRKRQRRRMAAVGEKTIQRKPKSVGHEDRQQVPLPPLPLYQINHYIPGGYVQPQTFVGGFSGPTREDGYDRVESMEYETVPSRPNSHYLDMGAYMVPEQVPTL